MRERFLIIGVLVGGFFGLGFRQFWIATAGTLGSVMLTSLFSLPSFARLVVVICGLHLLP
jgi:hypothetical protein